MPNFFITDKNGKKHQFTDQQLKELAAQGRVTPDTPLESDTGHQGLAGQIPGLQFGNAAPPSFAQPAQAPPTANVFCTNCGSPVSEQAVACMSCGARPTGHKKLCRHCGVALNPEQVICVKCGASLAHNSGVKGEPHNATDIIKTLNTNFKIFLICIVVGVPLFLASFGLASSMSAWKESGYGRGLSEGGTVLYYTCIPVAFITIFIAIGGWFFGVMLLQQFWKIVPEDIARITPGKAVGFIFIPFFNFYWVFVAYFGLGKDMNEALRQRGIQYQVNEILGITFCILVISAAILSMISYLGYWLFLAANIVMVLFFKSVKDGAVELLEQGGA